MFFIFLGSACHEELIPIDGWTSLDEDQWFYSLDECVVEAKSHDVDLISASMTRLPNHGDIMTQVYIFLIQKTIRLGKKCKLGRK